MQNPQSSEPSFWAKDEGGGKGGGGVEGGAGEM